MSVRCANCTPMGMCAGEAHCLCACYGAPMDQTRIAHQNPAPTSEAPVNPEDAPRMKSVDCQNGRHHCPDEECVCLCHAELSDAMAEVVDSVPADDGTQTVMAEDETLAEELASILNRHSVENGSNTPDFILAEYLIGCLEVFGHATTRRDAWYGIAPEPGWDHTRDGVDAAPTNTTEPVEDDLPFCDYCIMLILPDGTGVHQDTCPPRVQAQEFPASAPCRNGDCENCNCDEGMCGCPCHVNTDQVLAPDVPFPASAREGLEGTVCFPQPSMDAPTIFISAGCCVESHTECTHREFCGCPCHAEEVVETAEPVRNPPITHPTGRRIGIISPACAAENHGGMCEDPTNCGCRCHG